MRPVGMAGRVLIGLLMSGTAGGLHAQRMRVPVLDQIASWSISDPSDVVGGLVVDDSTAFIWTREGQMRMLRPGSAPVAIASPPVELAFLDGSRRGRVTIISSRDGSLAAVSAPHPRTSPHRRCVGLSHATSVLPLRQQLIAVLPDQAPSEQSRVVLFSLAHGGCEQTDLVQLVCAKPPTIAPGHNFAGVLSCPGPRAPLLAVTVRGDSMQLAALRNSVPSDTVATHFRLVPRWFPLPLLPLDSGFLQVLADVRSDTRRIELWDEAGRHIRTTVLHSPIGLFSSSPEHRLLLGMKGGDPFRLILYRWRWHATDDE